MSLSVKKLEDLLNSKNYKINCFFLLEKEIFYVEVFCHNTGESFLIYIPSKYNMKGNRNYKSYNITNINIENIDNYIDEKEYENDYGEEKNIKNIDNYSEEDMEKKLELNYDRDIKLEKNDNYELKATLRQLNRLKYCVKNLKYKIVIFFSNFLCAIRRDDTIDCFTIENYNSTYKKFFISTDLETFIKKEEKTSQDIQTIKESIYNILEKNGVNHVFLLEKLVEKKKDIAEIPLIIKKKNDHYDNLIRDSKKILEILVTKEKFLKERLVSINNNMRETTLIRDIDIISEKSELEKTLENISFKKEETYKIIKNLIEKRENNILSADKFMFDNNVMLNKIVNNFTKLKEIS